MNTDRTFDWRKSTDPRNALYPLRAVVGAQPRYDRTWTAGRIRTDQGREGACVGHGWINELMAQPAAVRFSNPNLDAFSLYREAQRADEWTGEDYSGTSVNAGAKVVRFLGYIDSWRWADGIDQVLDALVALGPVVIGIPWRLGMYDTLPDGLVTIGGREVGGHCLVLTGYYTRKRFDGQPLEVVRWRNSWGLGYGIRGDGYVRVDDLAELLADGEACVPIGRKVAQR
jgi:hypothetical protein